MPDVLDAAGWLPLTSAQQGLYFAHQLDPTNPCYTTAEVVELDGPVDAATLAAAHRAAWAEFEQLRVELAVTGDGPRQRVGTAVDADLVVVDVASTSAAQAWLRADLARPMEWGPDGTELVRAALLRLPDGRSWWCHAMHHVVADGYAAQQVLRRIAEHHDALLAGTVVSPAPHTSLAEVVAEDGARDDSAAETAWATELDAMTGVVALAGRTAAPAAAALREVVDLDGATQAALVAGARRLGVGWTDLVVAAVGTYLARMAGLPATRVGLPLMNRSVAGVGQLAAARTACTAMNVLPVSVPGDGAVGDVLVAVAAVQRDLRARSFVRQEQLARHLARARPGAQLFGAQVNLIPFDLELRLGAATGTVRNLTAGPVEDMTIGLRGTPGRGRDVRLEIDANPHLYDADELAMHAERLLAWVGTVAAADAGADLRELPLPTRSELDRIEAFNDTAASYDVRTTAQRFVDQATATTDAVALVKGEETRTYAELLERARCLAEALAGRGVLAGDVVGVALERSFGLYETVHALALIGAVYLPLDPDLPEARLAMMREDADVRLVVDDPDALMDDDCPLEGKRVPSRGSGSAPSRVRGCPFADTGAPAYLLFTSGSTGRPKGVLVGHAAIDNRLRWMQEHFRLAPGERVLHKTPISFDVSVWELYWPLQVGATVVIAEPGAHRDPRRIADLVAEHDVAVLHFVPSMLRAFLADRVSRTRVAGGAVMAVVCSGEALTPDLVAGCADAFGVAPTNLYGPTEAAVDVTVWDCSVDDQGAVPIGRPIANTTCHVLDERQRPVPLGVTGELWLGGVQLAEGYVGRPDLTAERFVEVRLPSAAGQVTQRLYRTGDLAAWRPDGALSYLGRTDDQVKVRGQRIELGEIEVALSTVPEVDAVTAGVVDGTLVLWFVAKGHPLTREGAVIGPREGRDVRREAAAALRDEARRVLPESWAPAHFVAVDAMPLGSSGKTDRKALVAAGLPDAAAAGEGAAPGSLLVQRLCALFGQAVGAGPLAADADFFAHGGDSLAVLRLIGRIGDDLGAEVGLADVFAAPTPAALAAAITSGEAAADGLDELVTLRHARGSGRAPLFLLPPAGGLGWCYTGLLPHLPADQPVHVLQAPGLATGAPTAFDDLEALATHQLSVIRQVTGAGTFHLAGWSLGGMAAHTVAALARESGQDVGTVLLLDAYPSDQWQHLAEPSETEALRGILRMGGVEGLLADGATVDRAVVADTLRAGGSALATLPEQVLAGCIASVVAATRVVRTSRHVVLPGDVDVLVATAPRPETWLDPTGWASYTKGAVRRHDVAATHGELVRRPAVAEVGAFLTSLLG